MWTILRKCCFGAMILLQLTNLVTAEVEPSILSSDISSFKQSLTSLDPRPRLSASQQTQILSDVQQHQKYSFSPSDTSFSSKIPNAPENSTPFSSIARYKVDRKKQNEQIQQQLQNLQHRIQQQQQQINTQFSQTSFQTSSPFLQQKVDLRSHFPFNNYQFAIKNYESLPTVPLPDISGDVSRSLLNDQQDQQLKEYYEKQRQLEILQRQKERLILEQQELRRQQELLRLQQEQLKTTILPIMSTTTTTHTPTTSLQNISENPNTTPSSVLVSSTTARRITPSENDIFLRAIATHQKKFTTTQKPVNQNTRHEGIQESTINQGIPKDLLVLLQAQQDQATQAGKPTQIKVLYQTEKPSTNKGKSLSASVSSEKDFLLKQLKIALAKSGFDDKERNVTTRDILLPNGKKLQVIHAPNNLLSNYGSVTTIKPPKAIFDEITKGVVPPGTDFEVLRQNNDGKLEELGLNPISNQPAKKVTFVVLEEQLDGSYKVQGVKGNAEKDAVADVDSIVERIKKGELKIPSSTTKFPISTTKSSNRTLSYDSSDNSMNTLSTTFRPTILTTRNPQISVSPNSVFSVDKYITSASSISGHILNTISPTIKPAITHMTATHPSSHYSSSISEFDISEIVSSTTPSSFGISSINVNFSIGPVTTLPSSFPSSKMSGFSILNQSYVGSKENLSNLLRKEGLFAMAKYLRQSGLDTVLNETGPYTIFVPTDKAFRTLLVQLGGPEKAEQKFHDNPRLLSGLLLHHVIPGAFRIDNLQDEMTGVSLAGTQLRVNVYSMHDQEWNDIKVSTINGARVAPNKRDVEVPQGLAHAIDRVMFPLPVGDLIQTLQADRERRFSNFLKIVHAASLEEMLSGTKTFTVFAPTDTAFIQAAVKNGGTPIWQEPNGPELAKEIVLRHIIPTTLYTAGMRYYHQKETLRQQVLIQIQKTGGRIRVNEGYIITYNVPATNGVLHAIDVVM